MGIFAVPSVSRKLFLSAALLVSCYLALCLEDAVGHTGPSSWCPNAFFNFGDSLTDTGNTELAMPGFFGADTLPYGDAFFGKPTGRASNGRLVVDYLLLAFKLPLLNPYLLPSHKNGMQRLNFAYAGATAAPDSWQVPFPLNYQVDQFINLRSKVLQSQREQNLAQNPNEPDPATYGTALYTIFIGGNDIMRAIIQGLQPKAIIQDVVPIVVNAIASAVHDLYFHGARKFIVFNSPPLGCNTMVLTRLDGSGFTVDNLGCIPAMNEINYELNSALLNSVQQLRVSLPNVAISYFDFYAANLEILANPLNFGFNPDVLHRVCCGAPGVGTLNYNSMHKCGTQRAHECDNPDEYLIWDGNHWTEAFYRHMAKFLLNGEFSDPSTNLTKACDLSFENFGNTTYEEVFLRSSFLSLFDE